MKLVCQKGTMIFLFWLNIFAINKSYTQSNFTLFAFKFNTLTKIPIYKGVIREVNNYEKKIHDKNFFKQIDASISSKKPLKDINIDLAQVRILVSTPCKKYKFFITTDLIVSYNNKFYELDNTHNCRIV